MDDITSVQHPAESKPAKPANHPSSILDLEKRQKEISSDLQKFYNLNAKSIERSRNLDLTKGDKNPDFQLAMDTFVETTKVILEGLTALANIHPVLGVAIFAFHGVINLDLTRRENDRQVLVVKLQMQSLMCSMCSMFQMTKFALPHVKDEQEKQLQQAPLQSLAITIAEKVTGCGSDINLYSSKKLIPKLLKAKLYQQRFADRIRKFAHLRSELQTAIAVYATLGIEAANNTLEDVKKVTKSTDIKIDSIIEAANNTVEDARNAATATELKIDSILAILERYESPNDREIVAFIAEHGGAEACIKEDGLLSTLLTKTRQSSEIDENLRTSLRDEILENFDDALKNNLWRFQGMLEVQNRSLQRISDQIFQANVDQSDRIESIRRTTLLLIEGGEFIKKAVAATAPIELRDPELQRIWEEMGLRRSVKAKRFVQTLRDYVTTPDQTAPNRSPPSASAPEGSSEPSVDTAGPAISPSTPDDRHGITSRPKEIDDADLWALKYINATHVRPIIEAMDEDCSGFISVEEANRFALERPPGMSLLHWIAYWASGWHYNLTDYRKKLYSIMIQMHRLADKVMLVNRKLVLRYLDDLPFFRLESILRSLKPLPDSVVKDRELTGIARRIAATQEVRLKDNLKTMGYRLWDADDVALITGPGRLEIYLLPLLYLVLKRHLQIFELAKSLILDDSELRLALRTSGEL